MEENNSAELEEGEACYYKEEEGSCNNNNDNNIDPDTYFSYIDEKIENVLGHLQKDFEGGVTAENLGPKFGGYGSFLPTYERSPPALPRQRSPERNSISTISQNNLSAEGVPRNLGAPATAPPSSRLKPAQCNTDKLHTAKFPSGNPSVRQVNPEPNYCSDPVAANPTKNGTLLKSGDRANRRPLKLRIKMGPDNYTKTNAALYSGLGLEDSPSTSLGSSSQESGGVPSLSVGNSDESPGSILQVMTSYPVLSSDLISPLHESLFSLVKEEVFPKDNKPAGNVKVSPGQNNVSVDQLVTMQGEAVLSQLKKIKSESIKEKPAEMDIKHSVISNSKVTFPMKKKIKNEMLNGEASVRYNLEKPSLSSPGHISGEPRKMAAKVSVVSGNANNVQVEKKLSSDSVKEAPLKPISGVDYGAEVKSRQKSTAVKAEEHGVSSSQDASLFNSIGNGKWKGEEVSILPKDRRHVAKNEEEFAVGEAEYVKWKAGHEAPSCENNEAGVPFQDEKPITGGKKKSNASRSDDRAIPSGKDRLRIVSGLAGKDNKRSSPDIPPSKKKLLKLTSGKHITGLGNRADASESLNGELNHPEVPSVGRQRDAVSAYPVGENDAVLANSWEMNNNGVISRSFCGAPVQGAMDAARGALPSEMVPAAASIVEDWVECESCRQWRLLPNGVKPADLADRWTCSMLNWLPGMNSCSVPEEVTTGIIHGSIPFPGSESRNRANGSTFAQNPQNVGTAATDGQGKNKLGAKEMPKKHKAEPIKSRSLNNMNPPPAEWNSLRRCDLPDSKSQDLTLGEKLPKRKEKNLNIGDVKLIKEKNKRKSEQFEFEASKRAKTDEISNGTKHGNSDIEVRKMGPSLGTPKLTLVKGKGHFDDSSSVKEGKHGRGGRFIVSVKSLSNQAQVSVDCASGDLENCVQGSNSLKKRKMRGSQDKQIKGEQCQHPVQDNKSIAKEEADEYTLRNEKKSRFSDTVIRDSTSGDGTGTSTSRSKKEGKVTKDFSSGIRNHFTDFVEGDRRPSKNGKKLAPKQATSSSSKVSGSQKSRVNYEAQGSPVESVSSSPLRVKNSAKFTSLGPDVPTRGDGVNGVVPVMDNVRKGSGQKANSRSKLSGFENGHVDGTTDHPQHGEFPVNNTSHDNGVYMKQSGIAVRLQKNRDISSLISNGKGGNSASDSDRDKVKAVERAGKKEADHLNKMEKQGSLVKPNHAPPFCEVQKNVNPDLAQKNEKNHMRRDLSKQNKHAQSDEITGNHGNHYGDYGLDSPTDNICPDPDRRVGAAHVSVESTSGKVKLLSHPEEESKQGNISRGSQLVGQRNTYNGLQMDDAANGGHSKASLRNKKEGASNGLQRISSEMHDGKDALSSSPSKANQSFQTASTVLKEAEKLRDLADRLKGTNFGFEGNESYFEAAMKFLQGASLLETVNGESSKYKEMTPMQVYSTAAKLCESCAAEFERCQELAAAALAYKCMEVAYMRVVYCKYASLNRDRHELQAILNQGESPSSSASDIDNLNNQAGADRSHLSKGAPSHAFGNHIVVARSRPSFVRLLDFTQDVNLAMEASRKSQAAFTAASAIVEESQNKDHIMTSLKKVIDFSFQDIDGLVLIVQLARKVISRSGFSGAKD